MNSSIVNGNTEILIAEDSPTQAAQLAHLLEQNGYSVTIAANGREALTLLELHTPAMIMSDVLMPEMGGYDLCRTIKASEELKHIPVMLVTTLSDPLDVIRGLECGADNFIRKPYDQRYLIARIRYLLMNRELRKNQKMHMGLEINLGGQRHFITSERQQILDLLISTYEQAVNINDELKAREKDLEHSNQVLNGMYRIAAGLNQAANEREVVELALERALELPGIQCGWISLREGETGFRLAAARNLPPALEAKGAMDGDCACRRRLLSGELDSVTNILECERLGNAEGDTGGLLFHASVPLWLGERTLGVMNLVGPNKGLFNADELQVLYGIGNQLAVALERAHLREHLEQLVEKRTARISRLNRVYAVLSGINTTIVRVRDRQQLFEEACRIAVEQGRFTFAWIGTLGPDRRQVTPVAKAGRDDGYLAQIDWTATEGEPGCCELTARALTLEAPVVCNDIDSDERMKVWRVEALQRGYRSVALFPLVLEGRPFGVFVIYAPESNTFDEEEMKLLVEMAGDISFAVDHIEQEKLLEQRTAALVAEVAERARVEREQARLVAIIEATPDFVATTNLAGKVLYCNQAGVRMLGSYPRLARDTYPEWAAKLVLETGVPHAIEHGSWTGTTAFLGSDGREIPVSQVILAHKGTDGSVDYLSTIAHDMTAHDEAEKERHRMERQLEQVRRVDSLGRVAATVAHEFNNVLMGIQPFAEVIGRRAGGDERIAKAAEQITSSVRRGKRVTEEILRFTRAIAPVLHVVDLGTWLKEIEPELREIAGDRVEVIVSPPPEGVFASCDSAQMQQVITNLVINARDAMPGGGAVTLAIAATTRTDSFLLGRSGREASPPEHERFALLTVRDGGSGIAPEMLDQIFDPFVTTKRTGTGLGLAVARQIVTQHGGFISAESDPDRGMAFHILLPQIDEARSTPVADAPAHTRRGYVRQLLLVEDEAPVAEGLSGLLELENIAVRVVERGREVVRAIEELAPDAVVLDLTLPDMDGRDVFALIKARWPDLPVVFSSGHGGEGILTNELAHDHVGFLQKPYNVAALIAAIERVL